MPLRIVPSWFGASHLLYTLENQPSRVVYPWSTKLKKSDIGWCGKKLTRRLGVGFGVVFGMVGERMFDFKQHSMIQMTRTWTHPELLRMLYDLQPFSGWCRWWCSFHPVGFMWSPCDSRCDESPGRIVETRVMNQDRDENHHFFLGGDIDQWISVVTSWWEPLCVLGKLFFWTMSLIEISGLQQAARHQAFSPNRQPTL